MTTSKHAAQRNQTALLILVEQTFSRKHQLAGTITGIRRVEKSAWKNRRWSAYLWRETEAPSSLIIHDDYARGREGVKFTTRDIAATSFSPIKAWSDCGLLTADLRFNPWQGRVHPHARVWPAKSGCWGWSMLEMKMVENFSRYPAISFNFYDIFWDGIINFLFFFFLSDYRKKIDMERQFIFWFGQMRSFWLLEYFLILILYCFPRDIISGSL